MRSENEDFQFPFYTYNAPVPFLEGMKLPVYALLCAGL